jgi:hypothetical protein
VQGFYLTKIPVHAIIQLGSTKQENNMGYRVLGERDAKWQPRKGLEGPFFYPNGQVLYYDPREGSYWDPTTDFYVPHEDVAELQQQFLEVLSR